MKAQTSRTIIGRQLQRTLRNSMTDAETHLWQRLRGRQLAGCKFRRQHPYLDFVLDFVCLEKNVIVEVDGGEHLESERDQLRDRRLREAGFQVLRFWNNQVLTDTDAVVEAIWMALQNAATVPHPHPGPPLEGEGDCAVHSYEPCSAHPGPLEGKGNCAVCPCATCSAHPVLSIEGEVDECHRGSPSVYHHTTSSLEGEGDCAERPYDSCSAHPGPLLEGVRDECHRGTVSEDHQPARPLKGRAQV